MYSSYTINHCVSADETQVIYRGLGVSRHTTLPLNLRGLNNLYSIASSKSAHRDAFSVPGFCAKISLHRSTKLINSVR